MTKPLDLGRGNHVESTPVEKMWEARIRFYYSGFQDANLRQIAFGAGNIIQMDNGGGGYLGISNLGQGIYSPVAGTAGHDDEIGHKRRVMLLRNATTPFVVGDRAKTVYKNNMSAYTWQLPPSIFGQGDWWQVMNLGSSGDISISLGTGVSLVDGNGNTGARSLSPSGRAVIHCIGSNSFHIDGSGVM